MRLQILLLSAAVACCTSAMSQYPYPPARDSVVVDHYFGIGATDRFRWLENTGAASTLQWYYRQSQLADNALQSISYTQPLLNEINILFDKKSPEQKFGATVIGDYVYYNQLKATDEQLKVYRQSLKTGKSEVIASPER